MPALTQAYETFERPGLVVSYRLAASTRIFKGAMVGVNAAGFAVPMAHGVAGLRFVGVANETVDNTAGLAGARSINLTKSGAFVLGALTGVTLTQADVGKEVFANTDWEFQIATAGLTNPYKVGTIVALEQTASATAGARVRIDNYTV